VDLVNAGVKADTQRDEIEGTQPGNADERGEPSMRTDAHKKPHFAINEVWHTEARVRATSVLATFSRSPL